MYKDVVQISYSSSSSIGTKTISWVSACSPVVEHSQQEGFYRVPLPAARQTHKLDKSPIKESQTRTEYNFSGCISHSESKTNKFYRFMNTRV
jgi:hypothetical protein